MNMDTAPRFCLLHAKLSKLGFNEWATLSEGDVMTGNPHTFALFLRFLYHRFPAATATLLRTYDWFLVEADDAQLGATTVRLLSTAAHETNLISAAQYCQYKYALSKVNMCHALLRLLRSMNAVPATSPNTKQLMCTRTASFAAPKQVAAPPPSPSKETNAHLRIKERRSELNSVNRI